MQQDDVTLAPDTLERLRRVSTATLTTQLFKNHADCVKTQVRRDTTELSIASDAI